MTRRRRRIPPFELEIERLDFGGVGVGEYEGREVRVRAAPPGARLRVVPFKVRRGLVHARRAELLRPPPGAVEPRCPLFGLCGGCALQELPLEEQRRLKAEMALRVLGDLEGVALHPPRGGPSAYGYRNKLELTFSSRRYLPAEQLAAGLPRDGAFLGFHAPGRFDSVVEVERCELAPEDTNRALGLVRAWLARSRLPCWDARRREGLWRHLLLREASTGERLVAVYTAEPGEREAEARAELDRLAAALRDEGVTGVLWLVNPRTGDAAQGELRAVLAGRPWIEERLGSLRFRLSHDAFFQTSAEGARALYETVAEALGVGGGRLLDLYAGTGSVGLWLAPRFDEVLGVESNPRAVEDARANAALNGVENARFLTAPLEELLRGQELPSATAVVVDPPRAGLHPRVARWLARFHARELVYVACHAPSLGRDRELLEAGGWRLRALWTVDLFPQTGHVEVVARFGRA